MTELNSDLYFDPGVNWMQNPAELIFSSEETTSRSGASPAESFGGIYSNTYGTNQNRGIVRDG